MAGAKRKAGDIAENVQVWLDQCLAYVDNTDVEESGRFALIVCRHDSPNNDVVFKLRVPEKISTQWSDRTGKEIANRLHAEAINLKGFQRWKLYAYIEGDSVHFDRMLVSLSGDDAGDGKGLDTEGPDARGLVSQAQRHTEALAKLSMASMASMLSSQQAIIDRQSSTLENLMADKIESIKVISELFQAKHMQEIDATREQAKADALKELANKSPLLLGALVNKISGKEILPVKRDNTLQQVAVLVKNIGDNPEKLAALNQVLSKEEMIAFADIYEQVEKAESKERPGPNGKGQ